MCESVSLSGRLFCDPGCHRQCQSSPVFLAKPPHTDVLLLPTKLKYTPHPALYLFIEWAAVSFTGAPRTVAYSADSRLSPCWWISLPSLALHIPLGVTNSTVLVPTSSSCQTTHPELSSQEAWIRISSKMFYRKKDFHLFCKCIMQ